MIRLFCKFTNQLVKVGSFEEMTNILNKLILD